MLDIGYEEKSARGKELKTCGTKRNIVLKDGTTVCILPIILDYKYVRGTPPNDVRKRRNSLKAIEILSQDYANYFNNSVLKEEWNREKVITMTQDIFFNDPFSIKIGYGSLTLSAWAQKDDQEFPIGFITATTRFFDAGSAISDIETFILPEYQQYGVGTSLVYSLLMLAKSKNISNFSALTYSDENNYPINWWLSNGAQTTSLIALDGDVDHMLETIEKRNQEKVKRKDK